MALAGIRDMSTIEEPPQDRLPVQTFVMEHDWGVLADAMRRELNRGGQVYYLHNRVDNIERTAMRIARDARRRLRRRGPRQDGRGAALPRHGGHGRGPSPGARLHYDHRDGHRHPQRQHAHHRGRRQAGPRPAAPDTRPRGPLARAGPAPISPSRADKALTEIAEKRLEAIREFAEFNSGFRIAMRDLEIRGAGNLLGAEQSGHLIDVGYDMYLKLLEEAVLEEKGEKPRERARAPRRTSPSTANIPESYVASRGAAHGPLPPHRAHPHGGGRRRRARRAHRPLRRAARAR